MEDYQAQTTVVDVMLTTFDNPYNPFDDYDKWWQWDKDNDYNTPELLARVMGATSEVMDAVELDHR